MAVVVPDDEDAHAIAYDPIQEMIGETFEVDPPQVGFEEMIPVGPMGSVQKEAAQLAIEVFREFGALGPLVIAHDLIYIGTDTPMQDEPHDLRRCCMCESRSRKVIA
jgi:hypothetical protein